MARVSPINKPASAPTTDATASAQTATWAVVLRICDAYDQPHRIVIGNVAKVIADEISVSFYASSTSLLATFRISEIIGFFKLQGQNGQGQVN